MKIYQGKILAQTLCILLFASLAIPATVFAEESSSEMSVASIHLESNMPLGNIMPANANAVRCQADLDLAQSVCILPDASGNLGLSVVVKGLPRFKGSLTPVQFWARISSSGGEVVIESGDDAFSQDSLQIICTSDTMLIPDGEGNLFTKSGIALTVCKMMENSNQNARQEIITNISDTRAPEIHGRSIPENSIEAVSPEGAPVSWKLDATDAVDADVPVTCDKDGSSYAMYGIMKAMRVSCTAKDYSGNMSEFSFEFTVVDTTRPILTGAHDMVYLSDVQGGANIELSKVIAGVDIYAKDPQSEAAQRFRDDPYAEDAIRWATDPYSEDVLRVVAPFSCKTETGEADPVFFSLGHTLVTCTVQDAFGNTSSRTFDVFVALEISPLKTSASEVVKSGAALPISFVISDQTHSQGRYKLSATVSHFRTNGTWGPPIQLPSKGGQIGSGTVCQLPCNERIIVDTSGLAPGTYKFEIQVTGKTDSLSESYLKKQIK